MKTLLILKPDGQNWIEELKESLCCDHRILQMVTTRLTRKLVGLIYEEHQGKDFFVPLVDHMISGPSTVLVVHGNPMDLRAWALRFRARFRIERSGPRNVIHASDTVFAASREVEIWEKYNQGEFDADSGD